MSNTTFAEKQRAASNQLAAQNAKETTISTVVLDSRFVNGKFPSYIQKQLDGPPPGPGGRHEALMKLALQMVGERIPDHIAFAALRAWIPDRQKSNKEIADLINGAYARNPLPATGAKREYSGEPPRPWFAKQSNAKPNVKRFKLDGAAAPEGIPSANLSTAEFLRTVFQPGETICITKTAELREGQWTIASKGTFQTREWWLQKLAERPDFYNCESGAWMRVNPFKPGTYDGTDKEVAAFRHVLVEFDKRPLVEQWRILNNCGLPITSVTYSGGDSLHALVRLDAKDAEEYKERQELVYEYLGDVMDDRSNKNASRWSRLPGAVRDGKEQKLVAVNIGAKSWDEWEAGAIDDGSELFNLDSLKNFDRENDPDCLIGDRWLCKGQSLIIQGPTGIGKSSLVLQMLMSWAIGRDFFRLKPVREMCSVLIQAENNEGDVSEPFQDICRHALRLTDENFENGIKKNVHIYQDSVNVGLGKFADSIGRKIKRHKPDFVFVDPMLTFAGGNLSDQEYMSDFLRIKLQPILNATGVILVFVHHTGKPPKQGEGRTGSKAYAGFGSSEIPNWAREVISVDDGGSDGVYTVAFTKRANRTGLVDNNGNVAKELLLRHAEGGLSYWLQATDVESKQKLDESREQAALESLRAYVEKGETVGVADVKSKFAIFGYAARTIGDGIATLLKNADPSRPRIYTYKGLVPGAVIRKPVLSIHPEPVSNNVQNSVENSKQARVSNSV